LFGVAKDGSVIYGVAFPPGSPPLCFLITSLTLHVAWFKVQERSSKLEQGRAWEWSYIYLLLKSKTC